jgi:hypothetical protein
MESMLSYQGVNNDSEEQIQVDEGRGAADGIQKDVKPIIYTICNQRITIDKNYTMECLEQLLYTTHLAIMRSHKIFLIMSSRPDYLDEDCKSFFNIIWKVAINDDKYTSPFVLTINSMLKINTADVKTWFETNISSPMMHTIQNVYFKNSQSLQINTITCIIDFIDLSITK